MPERPPRNTDAAGTSKPRIYPLRSFSEDTSPLLATHLPVEHRIRRLLNLGAG